MILSSLFIGLMEYFFSFIGDNYMKKPSKSFNNECLKRKAKNKFCILLIISSIILVILPIVIINFINPTFFTDMDLISLIFFIPIETVLVFTGIIYLTVQASKIYRKKYLFNDQELREILFFYFRKDSCFGPLLKKILEKIVFLN